MHEEEILENLGLRRNKMAIINLQNTCFLTEHYYELRPSSYTKELFRYDNKVYWYCEFFNENSLHHLLDPTVLSGHAIEEAQNKNCIIVLNNAHEAFHSVVRPIYDIAISKLKIPPEQILLVTESAIINEEVEKVASELNLAKINTKWMRLFEKNVASTDHRQFKTLEIKPYTKKFINFNRRWRAHRPAFVALLKLSNLLDQGYVSLAKADDNKDWDFFLNEIGWLCRENEEFVNLFTHNTETIKNIPEMFLDQKDMTINHAATLTDSTDQYYMDTYFSIVSETNFFNELGQGVFTSEKIFRPILKQHPFIIVSRPNTWQALKRIGYKSFHPYINESYDSETDDCKRMMMILEETKRLCSLTENELSEWLPAVREIVLHNYRTLVNKMNFITAL